MSSPSGGVLSLVVEHAPVSRRAFYASFLRMAQGGAIVLSGLVASIITSSFSERQVDQWAWRLPFILKFSGLRNPPLFGTATRTRSVCPNFDGQEALVPSSERRA